ncbi:uncharacterized protein LOC122265765 [Penaeus japonicus]|uniref:uncharacterized protein LOC122265765 n=1 Tax=Penaeus japonicus TaxID=27405 RepID=UPI001C70F87E|nr:uncharacterized protein LOC122265765 [Penaeus japonicus]
MTPRTQQRECPGSHHLFPRVNIESLLKSWGITFFTFLMVTRFLGIMQENKSDCHAVGRLVLCMCSLCLQWMFMQSGTASASLVTYGIHTEAPPLTSWTWLQKEIIFISDNATICFHLQLQRLPSELSIILTLDDKLHFSVNDMVYVVHQSSENFAWNPPVVPWQWVHLCLLLGKDITLSLDGVILEPYAGISMAIFDKETPFNITVGYPDTLYQDTEIVQPFGGMFTLPRVYMRSLESQELLALASCGQVSLEGLLEEEEEWQVLTEGFVRRGSIFVNQSSGSRFVPLDGAAGFLEVSEVDEEDLCIPRTEYKYMITVGKKMTHAETLMYCEVFGGSLLNASDPEDKRQVMQFVRDRGWKILSLWSRESCFAIIVQNDLIYATELQCYMESPFFACKVNGLYSR